MPLLNVLLLYCVLAENIGSVTDIEAVHVYGSFVHI